MDSPGSYSHKGGGLNIRKHSRYDLAGMWMISYMERYFEPYTRWRGAAETTGRGGTGLPPKGVLVNSARLIS